MAIQFPPVRVGDPTPQDGDTFLYLETQQEYRCHRRSLQEAPQWAPIGSINTTEFGYRGTLEITQPAPLADTGNIYSVIDGGIANNSFTGLAGTNVDQYTLIIFANPNWVPINVDTGDVVQGPWVRTVDGQIRPAITTDDLDMADGNFVLNGLPEL